MPKKKKTATTPRRRTTSSVKVKRRTAASRSSGAAVTAVGRHAIPLVLILVLFAISGYLGISGYRTATASDFFALRSVQVRGNERTNADEIRRVVTAGAEKPGVWNADLSEIRAKIEKFPFVKTASVSMLLPSGIRVAVTERVPAAVVRLSYGDYLVDGDGTLLAPVSSAEKELPIVLKGWDESKTEKAIPENLAKLKVYRKMLDEWKQFDLVSRVKEVNLANPREPVAVVEDSGRAIAVTLAKDNLGRSLKTAIEAVSGKGAKIRSVDAEGLSPVIQYLEF